MTQMPTVVLLILTWNRRADVLRCAASLSRLTYPNCLPVVIDNASADGTVAALRDGYPELTIIQNAHNLGYAGGNNVGIRWALEHDADYVLIINNDTEVTADMVTELLRVAESDPRIAVVGCRNILMDDPSRLWGAYGELTYGPFVVRTAGEGRPDAPHWQVVKDVDWVIGNGYLWRRAALERIGLLDESFFAYHEDVDWCLRARAAGFRVVYAGTAAILHKGAAHAEGVQRHALLTWYILGRNSVRLVRKYARGHEVMRFGLLCSGAAAFRLGRALLLRLVSLRGSPRARAAERWAMEIMFVHGLLDAIRQRPIPFDRLGLAKPARPPFP
jgi:GT2 family glycosyltransferase